MMRLALSSAASGLLRALLSRGRIGRDRILLTEWRSTDWQSITLMGERHTIRIRVPGPGAPEIVTQLTDGLEDAEFRIPGQIVADIGLSHRPRACADGSMEVAIEALTIAE